MSTKVNFAQAVSNGFNKYFDFKTVASRSEFWYWRLFAFLVSIVSGTIDAVLATGLGQKPDTFFAVQALVALGLLIPDLSITFRRLHDAGHSAHWLWTTLIPLVVFFATFPQFVDAALNGSKPESLGINAVVWLLFFLLATFAVGVLQLILLVKPTKTRAHGNRYAPAAPATPALGDESQGTTV